MRASGLPALSKSCGASIFALALAGSVATCDSESETDQKRCPQSSYESDPECVCRACDRRGGICTDGCYDAVGWSSPDCYEPHPPAADEILCFDLVNCPVGNICVAIVPLMDGCTSHECAEPPAACVDELTCGCISEYVNSRVTCEIGESGEVNLYSDDEYVWVD